MVRSDLAQAAPGSEACDGGKLSPKHDFWPPQPAQLPLPAWIERPRIDYLWTKRAAVCTILRKRGLFLLMFRMDHVWIKSAACLP
jgi:hypothetical protein